ncbi:hypothetical protein L596_008341 [Steinernema carpocapsae]|uniref:Uncharacterized protein n=1 Tax=Steinernema carpocapsae TaxID=34508 RepID=A0A4U5PCP4_STECR|nr:hypothetical protein L596_008341 [Steinernema carpocapsae]
MKCKSFEINGSSSKLRAIFNPLCSLHVTVYPLSTQAGIRHDLVLGAALRNPGIGVTTFLRPRRPRSELQSSAAIDQSLIDNSPIRGSLRTLARVIRRRRALVICASSGFACNTAACLQILRSPGRKTELKTLKKGRESAMRERSPEVDPPTLNLASFLDESEAPSSFRSERINIPREDYYGHSPTKPASGSSQPRLAERGGEKGLRVPLSTFVRGW